MLLSMTKCLIKQLKLIRFLTCKDKNLYESFTNTVVQSFNFVKSEIKFQCKPNHRCNFKKTVEYYNVQKADTSEK